MEKGKKINGLSVNDEYFTEFIITEEMILKFSEATGDYNPLHLSDDYAKKAGFKSRIAHGMLLAGLISNVLGTKYPGFSTIFLSQNLKFQKPAYINDKIKITIKIIETIKEKNRLRINTTCQNQQGEIILTGEAIVLAPKLGKSEG